MTPSIICLFHGNGSYGDAVRELDYGVGVLLGTLRSLGIDKETLVVFSSDNGGATYAKEQGQLRPTHLTPPHSHPSHPPTLPQVGPTGPSSVAKRPPLRGA